MNQEEYESVVHNQHLTVSMLLVSASSALLHLPAVHLQLGLPAPKLFNCLMCPAKLQFAAARKAASSLAAACPRLHCLASGCKLRVPTADVGFTDACRVASSWPAVQVNMRDRACSGAASCSAPDTTSVSLQSGLIFGLPVVFDTRDDSIQPGDKVLLTYQGQNLAVLTVDSKWAPNKPVEALKCYGTTSIEHPAVQMITMERGKYYLGEWFLS